MLARLVWVGPLHLALVTPAVAIVASFQLNPEQLSSFLAVLFRLWWAVATPTPVVPSLPLLESLPALPAGRSDSPLVQV
jgi:hypothetical protein